MKRRALAWVALGGLVLAVGLEVALSLAAEPARLEVVAAGLVNPRALAFGPDGALYVGEAGRYGPTKIQAGQGKIRYQIGRSARVLRVDPQTGATSVVLDQLPSVHWGDDTYGVTGLAFLEGRLFVLLGTGGRDVGDAQYDNVVLERQPDGSTRVVANLTAYNLAQPPLARRIDLKHADVEGGVPFGFAASAGHLFATDGNLETVTEIGVDGALRRLLEYPASNRVLTGLASAPNGDLYIAEFGPSPHGPNSAQITRLTLEGQRSDTWTGLDTAIGVAVAADGTLYAVEFSSGERVPNSGRLLRRGPDGTVSVLAGGLNFPTAVALAPDGTLYLAVNGHRSEDGSGQVVRVLMGGGGALGLVRQAVATLRAAA